MVQNSVRIGTILNSANGTERYGKELIRMTVRISVRNSVRNGTVRIHVYKCININLNKYINRYIHIYISICRCLHIGGNHLTVLFSVRNSVNATKLIRLPVRNSAKGTKVGERYGTEFGEWYEIQYGSVRYGIRLRVRNGKVRT